MLNKLKGTISQDFVWSNVRYPRLRIKIFQNFLQKYANSKWTPVSAYMYIYRGVDLQQVGKKSNSLVYKYVSPESHDSPVTLINTIIIISLLLYVLYYYYIILLYYYIISIQVSKIILKIQRWPLGYWEKMFNEKYQSLKISWHSLLNRILFLDVYRVMTDASTHKRRLASYLGI